MACHSSLSVSTKFSPLITPRFIIQATNEAGNMAYFSGQAGLIAFCIVITGCTLLVPDRTELRSMNVLSAA